MIYIIIERESGIQQVFKSIEIGTWDEDHNIQLTIFMARVFENMIERNQTKNLHKHYVYEIFW